MSGCGRARDRELHEYRRWEWRGSSRRWGKRTAFRRIAKDGRRHKHRDGLKQRGGARRGASGRVKNARLVASGICVQGLPGSLWISEMSPMRADSGRSTRNITRRHTDPMPHFAPS
jgi:hypothetical protein